MEQSNNESNKVVATCHSFIIHSIGLQRVCRHHLKTHLALSSWPTIVSVKPSNRYDSSYFLTLTLVCALVAMVASFVMAVTDLPSDLHFAPITKLSISLTLLPSYLLAFCLTFWLSLCVSLCVSLCLRSRFAPSVAW